MIALVIIMVWLGFRVGIIHRIGLIVFLSHERIRTDGKLTKCGVSKTLIISIQYGHSLRQRDHF